MHRGVDVATVASLDKETPGSNDDQVMMVGSGDWEPIPLGITIDSGAGETVIPPGWVPRFPTRQSEGSKAGVTYTAANGGKLPNQGEQVISFMTNEGHAKRMTFQVAPVKKPLASVRRIVEQGHKVVFDDDGEGSSYILNKATGQKTHMEVRNGVYVIEAWTPTFGRQGR